jgi:hypothetical protein
MNRFDPGVILLTEGQNSRGFLVNQPRAIAARLFSMLQPEVLHVS